MSNMRNLIILLALSVGLLYACIPAEQDYDTFHNTNIVQPTEPENPDPGNPENPTPDPGDGDTEVDIDPSLCNGVDPRLFKLINMNYPSIIREKIQQQRTVGCRELYV